LLTYLLVSDRAPEQNDATGACCLLLLQLLNESEATVLRLTEQASVLKGEIRRLERNQERENAISNMEYLKNIVYKVWRNTLCFMELF